MSQTPVLLNTGEIQFVLQREKENQRKLRLLQVRDQSKVIARHVREAVEKERKNLLDIRAQAVRKDISNRIDRNLKSLNNQFSSCFDHIKESHNAVAAHEQLVELQKQRLDVCSAVAQIRGKVAKREETCIRQQLLDERTLKIRRLNEVMAKEKIRAAKVANQPPPPKDPVDQLQFDKPKPKKHTAEKENLLKLSNLQPRTPENVHAVLQGNVDGASRSDLLHNCPQEILNKSRRRRRVSAGFKTKKSKPMQKLLNKPRTKNPSCAKSAQLPSVAVVRSNEWRDVSHEPITKWNQDEKRKNFEEVKVKTEGMEKINFKQISRQAKQKHLETLVEDILYSHPKESDNGNTSLLSDECSNLEAVDEFLSGNKSKHVSMRSLRTPLRDRLINPNLDDSFSPINVEKYFSATPAIVRHPSYMFMSPKLRLLGTQDNNEDSPLSQAQISWVEKPQLRQATLSFTSCKGISPVKRFATSPVITFEETFDPRSQMAKVTPSMLAMAKETVAAETQGLPVKSQAASAFTKSKETHTLRSPVKQMTPTEETTSLPVKKLAPSAFTMAKEMSTSRSPVRTQADRRHSIVRRADLTRELLKNFFEVRGVKSPSKKAFTKSILKGTSEANIIAEETMVPEDRPDLMKTSGETETDFSISTFSLDSVQPFGNGMERYNNSLPCGVSRIVKPHNNALSSGVSRVVEPYSNTLPSSTSRKVETWEDVLKSKPLFSDSESAISQSKTFADPTDLGDNLAIAPALVSDNSLTREETRLALNERKLDKCQQEVKRLSLEQQQLQDELAEIRRQKEEISPLRDDNEMDDSYNQMLEAKLNNVTMRRRCPFTYTRGIEVKPHELSTIQEGDSSRNSSVMMVDVEGDEEQDKKKITT